MKHSFWLLITLACCTRGQSSVRLDHAGQLRALRADLAFTGPNGIRFGCLPRVGDSTHFVIVIIVDSLHDKSGAGLAVVRRERAAPRPGYVYQAVNVEIQSADQTRLFGTSCWHDAGIAVRGAETALKDINVYLDAPASVLVEVVDHRGRQLGDSVRSTRQGTTQRITWTPVR